MRKIIEKIKGKGVKLSGRIFGALTACLSTIVAAYADAEEAGTGGVWSSAAAWITKNKEGPWLHKPFLVCALSVL